jgi:AsmA protein
MVRNAANAFLDPDAGEARKTDFAELGGSFTIREGVVTNEDMRLQAPVLRVNGRGRIDLPDRTLTYRIEPKAAKTLEGQGGQQDVAGILVPVVIEGPWDDLSFRPDLSGVVESALRDPEALKEQLQQLGKTPEQIKDAVKDLKKKGDVKDVLQGLGGALAGQGESDKESSGDSKEGAPAQKLLKGLFGN